MNQITVIVSDGDKRNSIVAAPSRGSPCKISILIGVEWEPTENRRLCLVQKVPHIPLVPALTMATESKFIDVAYSPTAFLSIGR